MTRQSQDTEKKEFNDSCLEDTPEKAIIRKNDHIRLCATRNVESAGRPFSNVNLLPSALPDFDFSEVDTAAKVFSRVFSMPLLITGMTGGVERGQEINEVLALVAQKHNIPMGLGSQKVVVQKPELKPLFDVRKVAPDVFLIGNMGVVSFNYGITVDHVKRLIGDFGLDAFALHVNALQECVQPEGERNFAHSFRHIENVVRSVQIPVIVKEVGCGIDRATIRRLFECGVAGVDVGGQGGTSWSAIEGMRGNPENERLGELFRDWGLPTDESLRLCVEEVRASAKPFPIFATGGIRDGLQVAKAVGMGASLAGVGLPLFKAVVSPPQGLTPFESVDREISFFKRSLAVAMFCSGSRNLKDLSSRVQF